MLSGRETITWDEPNFVPSYICVEGCSELGLSKKTLHCPGRAQQKDTNSILKKRRAKQIYLINTSPKLSIISRPEHNLNVGRGGKKIKVAHHYPHSTNSNSQFNNFEAKTHRERKSRTKTQHTNRGWYNTEQNANRRTERGTTWEQRAILSNV